MYGPVNKPLPTQQEDIESYWQEVEDRVELAEFGPVSRVDEERVDADWRAMEVDTVEVERGWL